ncbi:MAG: ABC transporter permease subunit [Faecousia sp.]
MRKLLSANFARLWKSKVFWALEGLCFGFGVFAYALVAYNTHNLGQGWLRFNAHSYFYLWFFFIPFVIGVFTSFFIGTEYSDGTLRNKLTVGHSREEIYSAFLLTTMAAAFLFVLAYLLAVFLVGLPFSGAAVLTPVQAQPWRLFHCGLILLEYAALFTLFSMLDSDKARNLIVSLLAAGILIVGGMLVYRRLTATEFIQLVIPQSDGSLLLKDDAPNPEYLTGRIRMVFTWLTNLLPSGAMMLSLDKRLGIDWRTPCCAVSLNALLTTLGIRLFQKKDIK